MKRIVSLVLALLLVAMLSAPALAKPGKGNAWGHANKPQKTAATEQLQLQNQPNQPLPKHSQLEKKAQKQVQQQVKKSLQQEYKAYVKSGADQKKQPRFTDTNGHWASQCIEAMATVGLFKGYPDGSFKPNQYLTQAEALVLVMQIGDEEADKARLDEQKEATDSNPDELSAVPAWVRGDACQAAKKGIIKLNRFHSAVQASRAQTAVMIAKALGLEPVDTSDLPFKDGILISKEDVGYILALYQEGIISGNHNGNFNPNKAITRAEMASILQRLLERGEIVSVSLPATATLEQGKSITLKATVKYADGSSDEKVTWSSSDTALATVENGVVTAAADKTGTVTITATANRGESTMSASCKVTVVAPVQVISGVLKETGRIGSHNGKVYEEYVFEVDGNQISLAQDNVKSITLQQDSAVPIELVPNTDKTLWFNVQRESSNYTLTVVDNEDNTYAAILNWTAPVELVVTATGKQGEHDGNSYVEYRLGDLDLSSFTCMYQIKPDGQVFQLTANSDTTLWFKTNNQVAGKHLFLIKKSDIWYSASISI